VKIEIESRHSDYGSDAGGYSVLRIDGVWIGRVEGQEARDKVAELIQREKRIAELEEALRKLLDGLDTCHMCGASLEMPERGGAHCEDCCSGCEAHDAPDCPSLKELYEQARIAALTAQMHTRYPAYALANVEEMCTSGNALRISTRLKTKTAIS
jgi:hypothetical protein